jgi:thiol-disulfide isomerase/thioredoxin
MPTIRGTVFGLDGQPAPRMLVRAFSNSVLRFTAKPVMADEAGRFEIPLTLMPAHRGTETRMYEHQVYAFSPYEPIGGVVTIDLRNEESVGRLSIRMTEQPVEWPLSEMRSAFTPWERGEPDDRMRQERLKPGNAVGSPVPELDGNLWLNTDRRSLAEFRGQFVFLDFYTTWCGPCRGDFPTVKLVYDVYRDHGVTVIGVHDNSSSHDAIREHAAEHHMEMPIIVDHEDGRTLKAYEKLWLAYGYPSYVLLDPNGRLVKSDRCTPSPTLRSYKLEVVRQTLLQHKRAAK